MCIPSRTGCSRAVPVLSMALDGYCAESTLRSSSLDSLRTEKTLGEHSAGQRCLRPSMRISEIGSVELLHAAVRYKRGPGHECSRVVLSPPVQGFSGCPGSSILQPERSKAEIRNFCESVRLLPDVMIFNAFKKKRNDDHHQATHWATSRTVFFGYSTQNIRENAPFSPQKLRA